MSNQAHSVLLTENSKASSLITQSQLQIAEVQVGPCMRSEPTKVNLYTIAVQEFESDG